MKQQTVSERARIAYYTADGREVAYVLAPGDAVPEDEAAVTLLASAGLVITEITKEARRGDK